MSDKKEKSLFVVDLETKEYRAGQIDNLDAIWEGARPKIKILGPLGETNWLNITSKELLAIKNILVKTTKNTV